jgi:transglutaminase-like putative cysteine protease
LPIDSQQYLSPNSHPVLCYTYRVPVISIPARLVVGYLYQLEPMDLHAWFEAYIGGRWYTFDPTQSGLRGGRVIIAFGRDAADVSIFHQFGLACILTGMDVQVNLLNQSPEFSADT